MGSDMGRMDTIIFWKSFQSTLPAWGATVTVDRMGMGCDISIHAPRMGSDHSYHQS